MNDQIKVHRRTFAAKAMPAGSPERAAANGDARTSEYTPSHKYCYAAVAPSTGARTTQSGRTKAETRAAADRTAALGYVNA